jgi:FkbM family methyltransferase
MVNITLQEVIKWMSDTGTISSVDKVPLYSNSTLHNEMYSIHRFTPPKLSHPVTINTITQEILKTGGFHFCTMKNDTCVSDSLRANILFEKFLLSFISKLVPPEKDMLDVGSNIGVWSIIYSTVIKGNIYAFEPQQTVYDCLLKNITLNSCANIVPYNYALSDKHTTYRMNASYDSKENFGAFRISSDGELHIEARVGDSLQLDNIGFIKMDVEGHELEAIQGLTETITRCHPLLFVEIHNDHPNSNRTYARIKELGYTKVLRLTHCDYLFVSV